MNLSHYAHLKNKYPGGHVVASEDSLDAYCADGRYRVALRKNGAGQWVDMSKVLGADDMFCLAPIPKDARVWKHYGSHVGLSEEHAERTMAVAQLVVDGKVPSQKELDDAEADSRKKAAEAKLISAKSA